MSEFDSLMNAAYAARREGTSTRIAHYFWRLVERGQITPEVHERLVGEMNNVPPVADGKGGT